MEQVFDGWSEVEVNAKLQKFLATLDGTVGVLGMTWHGPNGTGQWKLVFNYEVVSSDDPCWTSHPIVR